MLHGCLQGLVYFLWAHSTGSKFQADLYLGQNPDIGPLFIGLAISFVS